MSLYALIVMGQSILVCSLCTVLLSESHLCAGEGCMQMLAVDLPHGSSR